jgi:hypothetical protein
LSLERSKQDQNDRIPVTLQDETTDGCLRSRYEAAVLALRAQVAAMRGVGVSSETIARAIHAERRRLTIAFKEVTPEPWRSRIHTRTLAAYGDPIGPTIENLRGRGKCWDDIIASATRPGSWFSSDGSIDNT